MISVRFNVLSLFLIVTFASCSSSQFSDCEEHYIEEVRVCSPVSLDFLYNDGFIHDRPQSVGEINTINKAFQLALIEWIPKRNMPCVYGDRWYAAGILNHGAPYSSVKHLNNFLGLDISLYTFMTALDNPRSYIYSENVNEAPYYGTYCAAYYGTVCSTSVMYALGSDIPYFTDFIPTEEVFEKCAEQTPESIKLCDILWTPGHMVMVIDIGRNSEGEIQTVSILESGGSAKDTEIIKYSISDFKSKWHWTRYQYLKIDDNDIYTPSEYVVLPGENPNFIVENRCLSTHKGDAAPYRTGDEIIIDSFDSNFSSFLLKRNGETFAVYPNSCEIHLKNLPFGQYEAYLYNNDDYSRPTVFEVIDTNVKVERGLQLGVFFSSQNARPVYICICEDKCNKPLSFIPLSKEDVTAGQKYVALPDNHDGSLYCKVIFAGQYGRVSNEPIKLD